MSAPPPPKFPRVPHLAPSLAATPDDVVLAAAGRDELLQVEVVVEEKLDGMNVMVWVDDGVPRVGTRGGAETSDRSGERGRLKAWAAMRSDLLVAGLGERFALYGEWLRRRHGVAYDRLPAELVGLDVHDRDSGEFLGVEERDAVLAVLAVPAPPRLFRGTIETPERLEALFGASAFSDDRAEGIVVRAVTGTPRRVAKLVDPFWHGIGATPWEGENRLAE
ncbi:MAG TPA: RNA ligase family protein [Conexibacter sp.]|nr:RNA ligase family protein [Conexibacter sp.]